jgi:hypothetical protein
LASPPSAVDHRFGIHPESLSHLPNRVTPRSRGEST